VFLNSVPFHPDGRRMQSREIRFGDKTVYMDANHSQSGFVGLLCRLYRSLRLDWAPVAEALREIRRG